MWDFCPRSPFICPEKGYSRHKQSAEFVAIKRPLKKSNQSLSLEGIFGCGEGALARLAGARLSSFGFLPLWQKQLRSFAGSRYVVTI